VLAVAEGTSKDCQQSTAVPDRTNERTMDVLSRWKEECSSIARKMEHNMNDSRNELTRERRRNEELTRLLRESREKTIEASIVIVIYLFIYYLVLVII